MAKCDPPSLCKATVRQARHGRAKCFYKINKVTQSIHIKNGFSNLLNPFFIIDKWCRRLELQKEQLNQIVNKIKVSLSDIKLVYV